MINAYPKIPQAENHLSSSTSHDAPLLSIVVPNYNHARFLPERFASILAQTFQDFELVVLDDASTDGSVEVIRALLANIPHKLIINQSNSGSPCSQWLRGIQEVRGHYIWIAESDDSCTPDFLATMMELMKQGASLAYCRSHAIDSQSKLITGASYWPDCINAKQWRTTFAMPCLEFCLKYLINANVLPNASAVVFRRDLALRCFEPVPRLQQLKFIGDWLFWLRYLTGSNGSILFSSSEDSFFRSHPQSTRSDSGLTEVEGRRIREYCLAIDYISRHPDLARQAGWLSRAINPGWDWLLLVYNNRVKPSLSRILKADGLDGLLGSLLLIRLVLSKELRRTSFPGIYLWLTQADTHRRTFQANLIYRLKRLFK